MKEHTLELVKFYLEGAHYDIGLTIGKALSQYETVQSINVLSECVNKQSVAHKKSLIDEFCPGIFDELTGLAEGLNIPIEKLSIMSDDVVKAVGCSQFIAMPSITSNGHVLVGRSYEFSTYDELCICVIRAIEKPAHIGFSIFLSGRFEGINEHGLVVSMSSCEFRQEPSGEGFWFPLVLRSLLDNCKNVSEAMYLLKKMPIRSNINILIADKNDAVIAETACFGNDRRISFRKDVKYLIATNHYMNEDMMKYDNNRGKHSVIRYQAIQNALLQNEKLISVDTIKTILEQKIPEGVYCPYYDDYLGTLHSIVFNVTRKEIEICFGLPERHKWERISFNETTNISSTKCAVVNEYADNASVFWSFLSPGAMNI